MRILLLTDDYLPHRGGSRVYYHELLSCLPDAEISVLTRSRAGAPKFDAEQPYRIARTALEPSCRLRPLRLQFLPIYWRLFRCGLGEMVRTKPDCLLAGELVPTGPVAAILAAVFGKPLIVFTHAEGPSTIARTRWQSRLARWVCGRADVIIAASDNAADGLTERLGVTPDNIRVLPPGVGDEHFEEAVRAASCAKPDGPKRLLTVGRLVPRKGHIVVLEALSRIRDRFPGIHYTIAGSGPSEPEIREAVERLLLTDRVTLAGHVSDEALGRLYAESDLFVLANRDDPETGDTEGFVIALGEAAAHGLPVIGGRAGGTAESVLDGETGLRVDGADPDAVAGAIEQVLGDPGLAKSFGEKGRERARKQFRWPGRADVFGGILREVAGSAGSAWARFIRRWAMPLFLAIVLLQSAYLFFVYSETYPYSGIAGSDGQAYYATLRSAWIDHDLDFTNEFGPLNFPGHGRDALLGMPRSPLTGLLFNRYPIGFALLMVPFFAVAHFLTLLGNALRLWSLEPNGYSMLYQLAAPANAIFWALCAFAATRCLLRRFVSPALAAAATLVLFLCFPGSFTIIWFWCNPHIHTMLVFALLLLTAFRVEDGRDGPWTWAALGALVGLAGLLRTESLVLGLFPFLLFCHRFVRREAARSGLAVAVCPEEHSESMSTTRLLLWGLMAPIACGVVFAPQIVAWRLMWGEWFVVPMNNASETFNWSHPVFLKVLFSTRHGLFYWSPVMLLGAIGFVWLLVSRKAGVVLKLSAVQLLALYYVFASWSIWWMGYSFGARQFIIVGALFALGLAVLFERFARHGRWLAAVSALLILWNWAMLYMFLNGHIPRSEGFEPLLPVRKFLWLVGRAIGV